MRKDFTGDLSQLEPLQRFQVSIKALEREDIDFFKRLVRSCEKGRVEYRCLFEAARVITEQVAAAIHVVLGGWELVDKLLIQMLDSEHVDHYHARYRGSPCQSIGTEFAVEAYFGLPGAEAVYPEDWGKMTPTDGSIKRMVVFMPCLLYSYHFEPDSAYISKVPGALESYVDSCCCVITCYMLQKVRESVAAVLAGPWLAFSDFCRSEIDLDPNIVIKVFATPAALHLIEEFSPELQELSEAGEIDAEWESSLRNTWRAFID